MSNTSLIFGSLLILLLAMCLFIFAMPVYYIYDSIVRYYQKKRKKK